MSAPTLRPARRAGRFEIADHQRRGGVHVIETAHTIGFLAPANRRLGKRTPEAAA